MNRWRNPAGGARDDAPAFRPAPCGLYADAPEHVGEVVVDRVQVLRSRIHGTHLDDEPGPDDAVAERLFRRVRPVPGKAYGLPIAGPDACALGGGQRCRKMLARDGLYLVPKRA